VVDVELIACDWRVDKVEAQYGKQQRLKNVYDDDRSGDTGKEKHSSQHEQSFTGIETGGLELPCGCGVQTTLEKGRHISDRRRQSLCSDE
jgi:hypothetical protein